MLIDRSFAVQCVVFPCLISAFVCSGVAAQNVVINNSLPREERIIKFLTEVRLIGTITVEGQKDKTQTFAYRISKCEKLSAADMYRCTVLVKDGEVETKLPQPINVKILWIENTPVVTLHKQMNPGLMSFSARVLIFEQRCAGSWQFGDIGGHFFGRFEKRSGEESASGDSQRAEKQDASR